MLRARHLLFGALLFLASASAFGDEAVRLFRNRLPVIGPMKEYDSQVQKLAGKTVEFSNGKKLKLGERLGSGKTTVIYELADDPTKVVRLALNRESLSENYLKSTWNGYSVLKQYDAPVVQLFENLSGEYVIAERVGPMISFDNFFKHLDGRALSDWDVTIDDELARKMTRAFETFAGKTAAFNGIGDFYDDQLVYDLKNERWVILDWTSGYRLSIKEVRGTWEAVPELSALARLFRRDFSINISETAEGLKCSPIARLSPEFLALCDNALRTVERARLALIEKFNASGFRQPSRNCILRFFGVRS